MKLAMPRGRIFGEFVLVVLGVLAALMVDTWIEQRNDENLRQEYLVRLSDDLNLDRQGITNRISFFEEVREFGVRTLARLHADKAVGLEAVVEAYYAAEIFAFEPIRNTYEDLQSTGNIRLLRDIELRTALASYHSRATSYRENISQEYREVVRGIIPWEIQAAIRSNCPTTDAIDDIPTGFPPCELPDVSQQEIDAVLAAIKAYPRISEILTYRISEVDVKIFLYGVQRERIAQVFDKLKD